MAKEKKALLVTVDSAVMAYVDVCKVCKATNILIPSDGTDAEEKRIFCVHVAHVLPSKKGITLLYAEPELLEANPEPDKQGVGGAKAKGKAAEAATA